MKRSTLLACTWMFCFLNFFASAQNSPQRRCTTMELLQQQMKDPVFKAQFEANQQTIMRAQASARTTNSVIKDTIPVVVHIIMANPNTVTDAVCQSQMDVLTEDFTGKNADSTRIPAAFKSLFAKGGLTFMLARTAPNGTLTTGIERRTNNITFTASNAKNAKKFATGGLDAWDVTKYFNMWVVQFTDGTLGISVFPGTPGDPALHGYCCDYRSWGRNAPYLYPSFNKGRTATHEIGHFWNLSHIWGDDGSSCVGSDFAGSPASWDDTPNQTSETYGNPDVPGTGTVKTDACSPAAPGIMYQNYMDYSDDVALVMFTHGQWLRMDQALLNAPDRKPLLNSLTYQLPSSANAFDASIEAIVSPAAAQEFCAATSIQPVARLVNLGNTVLTSATITASIDGGAPVSTQWSGSLAFNSKIDIPLTTLTGITGGTHTLSICVTNLNGGQTDAVAGNNCQTVSFTVITPASLPITESFESTTFPPAGWAIINPDAGTFSWARSTLAAKTGSASARVNIYSHSGGMGNYDYLRSPLVRFSPATADSALATFSYAYRRFSANANDTLEAVVSANCGSTWTSVWKKGGRDLVSGSQDFVSGSFTPNAAEWAQARVDLTQFIGANSVYVAFRTNNQYGQNIYLDDVNIFTKLLPNNDAQSVDVTSPVSEFCDPRTTPKIVVRNSGKATITSLKIGYSIDNGTPAMTPFTSLNLANNSSFEFTLPLISNLTTGMHTIKVFTSEPNGVADEDVLNDTLVKIFFVKATVDAPLAENFESITFPPNGWSYTQQPTDAITWKRATTGAKNSGGSAYMNNFNYSSAGAIDNLATPLVRYANADSVFLSFDVAASTTAYPGSASIPTDTLEVLVTKDCGLTYTSIYKKYGYELQTIGNINAPHTVEFIPTASTHWRTELIDVSRILGDAGTAYFTFRNTNNFENNIYIDNVQVNTKTLPAKLKANGFMVAPSPFTSNFVIQHYLPPTDLRGFTVYNSVGQQIVSRSFGVNGADSYINVSMSGFPAGVYTLQLLYSNRTISQKIVKVN